MAPQGLWVAVDVSLNAGHDPQGVSGSHGYSAQSQLPFSDGIGLLAGKTRTSPHLPTLAPHDHNPRVGGSSPSSGIALQSQMRRLRATFLPQGGNEKWQVAGADSRRAPTSSTRPSPLGVSTGRVYQWAPAFQPARCQSPTTRPIALYRPTGHDA